VSELGLRLKTAREEKGYSYEELQQITKIQKRYLIAIEEGDFSKMPGEFYGRAFVKSYSEAVGLDSDMVFEEHKDELPHPKREPTDLPPRVNRSKPQTFREKSKLASFIPTVVAVLFILVIAAGLWLFKLDGGDDSTGVSRQEQQSNPNVELTDTVENNEEKNDEMNEETNEENEDNLDDNELEEDEEVDEEASLVFEESEGDSSRYSLDGTDAFDLSMEFSDQSWVRISDGNGERIHEQTHSSGDKINYDLSDESEVTIRVGSTLTADLYINDVLLEYPLEQTTQNIVIEFR